jgi:hypothetical protein
MTDMINDPKITSPSFNPIVDDKDIQSVAALHPEAIQDTIGGSEGVDPLNPYGEDYLAPSDVPKLDLPATENTAEDGAETGPVAKQKDNESAPLIVGSDSKTDGKEAVKTMGFNSSEGEEIPPSLGGKLSSDQSDAPQKTDAGKSGEVNPGQSAPKVNIGSGPEKTDAAGAVIDAEGANPPPSYLNAVYINKPDNWPPELNFPPEGMENSIDENGNFKSEPPPSWPAKAACPPTVVPFTEEMGEAVLLEVMDNIQIYVGKTISPTQINSEIGVSIKNLQDILDMAGKLLNEMPDSPLKQSYVDYLKAVGQALVQFQTYLYQLQSTDSKQQKELSQANLDAALDNIKKQHDAMAKQIKAANKAKKKAKLGILGKILTIIQVAFTAMAAAFLSMLPGGQIAAAMLVMSMCDTVAKTYCGDKLGITGRLMEHMPSNVQKAFAVIAVVSMAMCPMAFAFGGADMTANWLCSSGLVPEDKAGVVKMGFAIAQMVAQLAITIVMCIIPGGQAAFVGAIANITKTSLMTAEQVLKVVKWVATSINLIVTLTDQSNKIALNVLDMNLKRALGDLEKSQEELTAQIKVIKAAIKKLLESMQQAAGNISQINKDLGRLFKQTSQNLDGLFQSILA